MGSSRQVACLGSRDTSLGHSLACLPLDTRCRRRSAAFQQGSGAGTHRSGVCTSSPARAAVASRGQWETEHSAPCLPTDRCGCCRCCHWVFLGQSCSRPRVRRKLWRAAAAVVVSVAALQYCLAGVAEGPSKVMDWVQILMMLAVGAADHRCCRCWSCRAPLRQQWLGLLFGLPLQLRPRQQRSIFQNKKNKL